MFQINDDMSIYVTRGDIVSFTVGATAKETGMNYIFKNGDIVRIKVFEKKACEVVVLQKDFLVEEEAERVTIFLGEEDTRIGETISKPTDYWYEVELNPNTYPQTIIGYDENGAKVFKLYPEGEDLEFEPTPDTNSLAYRVERHLEDEGVHITSEERESLNKNAEDIESHKKDATVHVTQQEKNTWNMNGTSIESITKYVTDMNKNVDAHIDDGTVHVTAQEKGTWNTQGSDIRAMTTYITNMRTEVDANSEDIVKLTEEVEGLKENGGGGSGATVEQIQQIETNKEDIGKLQEEIADLKGGVLEPSDDDIPKVFLSGNEYSNMTIEKNEVNMELDYVSKTEKFHSFIKIKFQGSSSLVKDKKNFTIKMYEDESKETKLKKDFRGWGKQNKYCLKANFIDHSHARNIVSAHIWSDMMQSRSDYESIPEEIKNSPNHGAIDGFPIKLYINGTYQGIYTWNIPKDAWMVNMDEDNENHMMLCCSSNQSNFGNAANFRSLWSGVNESLWDIEVGTEGEKITDALNALISCVKDTDDETFKATLGKYLNINSAIDYYLYFWSNAGLDSLGNNLILYTFDGKLWYCGAYDMDSIWGLHYSGSSFISAEFVCPDEYQASYSLLWERIVKLFVNELKERYAYLRKTTLSYAHLVTSFENFMDIIGSELYAEDLTIYPSIPSGETNNIKQIRNYIRDRLAYVDTEIESLTEPVACTGITLNVNTLTFTEEGTKTLTATVTPENCTEKITWESDNKSIAIVSDGVVTTVSNGSCNITATCGNYSASCSVNISGLPEYIACTGITLSAETLTFNGEGTQILTATVTPNNCSDEIVWESDDTDVVTVSNGVVASIGNGNAVVTAMCGNYSASCNVAVSGFVADGYSTVYTLNTDMATDIPLTTGYVLETTGIAENTDTTQAWALLGYVDVRDIEGSMPFFVNSNKFTKVFTVMAYDSNFNYISTLHHDTSGASSVNIDLSEVSYIRIASKATSNIDGDAICTIGDGFDVSNAVVMTDDTMNVKLEPQRDVRQNVAGSDGCYILVTSTTQYGCGQFIRINEGYQYTVTGEGIWLSIRLYNLDGTFNKILYGGSATSPNTKTFDGVDGYIRFAFSADTITITRTEL